jgi:Glyoxalase-like domain
LLELDHIVVGATALEEGVKHVEDVLGVTLSDGGKHGFMGTHNKVLRLGAGVYLEVIAIDRASPAPLRPRWFSLDSPEFQDSLIGNPRIIHWVVRTRNIEQAVAQIECANHPIISASRGALKWKITIPDDGSLLFDGAFPTLIEWTEGAHVSEQMADKGCKLAGLKIEHPRTAEISALLQLHFQDDRVALKQASSTSISAVIATPAGPRILV